METLLEYPFNGANFSSRLWKQKDHLQTQLMESLTTMMIQGRHPSTLAKDFAKKMQSKKFDAYRLLHTESSFLMSEATHAGYKEDGIEKYQILATLDSKTCGVCGDLDRKVYEVDKAVVGVNMPPFHPLCRCTDTPYREGVDHSSLTRTARDADGNYIDVPADMTYKEWRKKFIEKASDSGIMETEGETLKMNLQFFAESDIKNQESASLKRAIRKYEKRIAEHEDYLKNPEGHCNDWNEKHPREQEGLKRHWQKEIQNFRNAIKDREDELKERGDYDD